MSSFLATLALPDLGLIEQLLYIVSAICFVLGLKKITKVKSARAGNRLASFAMLLAIALTVFLVIFDGDGAVALPWMLGGLIGGGLIGLLLAKRVAMTEMPELVAFFNGMGGASSMFVALASAVFMSGGLAVDATLPSATGSDVALSIGLSILIGAVTLTGSLIAYGKLAGKIWKNRFGPIGSQGLNALLAVAALAAIVYGGFVATGSEQIILAFAVLTGIALFLGVGLVVPIGGADMPVVISLLNSYSGIAAAATGFVLQNNLLIV
ncbi:MAG: NAD(P)(+) transhydrogenase (Re/Si-specific) subunit beta, partial [Planctomycetota bacterium]|nr:NAD(P)(+) transhydrogenase (Re/Si-specific) subunit beta [Planctomycetota bacterium]